jgi:hypothetical protein
MKAKTGKAETRKSEIIIIGGGWRNGEESMRRKSAWRSAKESCETAAWPGGLAESAKGGVNRRK